MGKKAPNTGVVTGKISTKKQDKKLELVTVENQKPENMPEVVNPVEQVEYVALPQRRSGKAVVIKTDGESIYPYQEEVTMKKADVTGFMTKTAKTFMAPTSNVVPRLPKLIGDRPLWFNAIAAALVGALGYMGVRTFMTKKPVNKR